MDRYGLALPDFFHGEDALRERIAAKLVPPALSGRMGETMKAVDGAVERLRATCGVRSHAGQGPGTQRPKDPVSTCQDRRQSGPRSHAARRAGRRDAASLYGLIFPERHLQERLYSILPFLAKHGPDLIDRSTKRSNWTAPTIV